MHVDCTRSYIVEDKHGRNILCLSGQLFDPVHGISNNVVCATSNASDQPAYIVQILGLSLVYYEC